MAIVTDGDMPNYTITGDHTIVHILKVYNGSDGQGFTWVAFDVKAPEYVIEMNDDLEIVLANAKEYADGVLVYPDTITLQSEGWIEDYP